MIQIRRVFTQVEDILHEFGPPPVEPDKLSRLGLRFEALRFLRCERGFDEAELRRFTDLLEAPGDIA